MPFDEKDKPQSPAAEMLESVRHAAQEISSPRTRRLSALALAQMEAAAADAVSSNEGTKITFFADRPGQPAPTGAASDHYTHVTGETPHTYTDVTEDHTYTEVTRTPVDAESVYFTASEGRSSRAATDVSVGTVLKEPSPNPAQVVVPIPDPVPREESTSPEDKLAGIYNHIKYNRFKEAQELAEQLYRETNSIESFNLVGVLKILPVQEDQINEQLAGEALDHLCVLVDEDHPKHIFFLAARGFIKSYFPNNEINALDDLENVKKLMPNYPGIDPKIESLREASFKHLESQLTFMG